MQKHTVVVTNAFSINMLTASKTLTFTKITIAEAKVLLDNNEWFSAVGHLETAKVFSAELGLGISPNRINFQLAPSNDESFTILVGQYKGPRLPEGATSLPEGAIIEWWLVRALDMYDMGL